MIHLHTGKSEGLRWYNDLTLCLGSKAGARFISIHLPLHTGWSSRSGKGRSIKGGWEYYQPAILTGRLLTNTSKWHHFPTIYFPAKIVSIWKLRKKSWRKAMKEDAKLAGGKK